MPFSLDFNSDKNKEKLDRHFLEVLGLCNPQSIDTISFDNDFNQTMHKLPNYIKHIKFRQNFTEDISNIGDHIESLQFSVDTFNYNLETFPKNLKKLIINANKIISTIDNVPNCLEKLTIQCNGFNSLLMLSNCALKSLSINSVLFSKTLSCLPNTLTELTINSGVFNCEINNLPSSLEYLKISCKMFNKKMDNLPSNLKKLILEDMEDFHMPLDNLPESIASLDLHFGYEREIKYKHIINNVMNCRKLRLANYWGDLNLLPDSTIELDIWYPPNKSREVREYIQHWHRFPSSLKILNINQEMIRMNRLHDMTDIIRSNISCAGIFINGSLESSS
jgi:hypothetical protein